MRLWQANISNNGDLPKEQWNGGPLAVYVAGTWGGASATVKARPRDTTRAYASVGANGELTADGWVLVDLPHDVDVTVTIGSEGATTDLDVYIGKSRTGQPPKL